MLTEHEPLTRVHEPPRAKDTFPVGITAVPGEVSDTVAVHDEAWFTTTGLEQTTDVEVARGFTETLAEALVLPPWLESPPYVPVTSALPEADGVNVTEQMPDDRVQVIGLKEPEGPVSVKLTEPVGVVELVLVSVTVAVHNDPW